MGGQQRRLALDAFGGGRPRCGRRLAWAGLLRVRTRARARTWRRVAAGACACGRRARTRPARYACGARERTAKTGLHPPSVTASGPAPVFNPDPFFASDGNLRRGTRRRANGSMRPAWRPKMPARHGSGRPRAPTRKSWVGGRPKTATVGRSRCGMSLVGPHGLRMHSWALEADRTCPTAGPNRIIGADFGGKLAGGSRRGSRGGLHLAPRNDMPLGHRFETGAAHVRHTSWVLKAFVLDRSTDQGAGGPLQSWVPGNHIPCRSST